MKEQHCSLDCEESGCKKKSRQKCWFVLVFAWLSWGTDGAAGGSIGFLCLSVQNMKKRICCYSLIVELVFVLFVCFVPKVWKGLEGLNVCPGDLLQD